RLALKSEVEQARRDSLRVLAETEDLFGPSVIVCRQREVLARALGQQKLAEEAGRRADQLPPRSAWEYAASGRTLLLAERVEEARSAFEQAQRLQPRLFWAYFY